MHLGSPSHVLAILICTITAGSSSADRIVFDSLTDSPELGFAGVAFAEVGQVISLQGSQREVTEIELWLAANTNEPFWARLYELDATGIPGRLMWESPRIYYPYTQAPFNQFNRKIISIDVPNVTVPTSFAWTVESEIPRSNLYLINSDQPRIGIASTIWSRGENTDW